ncbi:UNVERIFIED_ORG: hypothetical protein LHK14_02040 [Roseateles sp. XES5]|nr:Gp49 family protein [Roseateles sp. XES5]
MTSSLQVSDAESTAVQKTLHRVSLDAIENEVASIEYIRPNGADYMTIAVVIMRNGYVVLGKSAPADPENFNKELGEKFAREDAIRQIWPLMGYALREKLAS